MFISWTRHHGRSADLAQALGMEAIFIDTRSIPGGVIRRYLKAIKQTRTLVRADSPAALVVMLPPAPLLVTALVVKPRGTILLADAHTGFFLNPKWKWFTGLGLRLLRGSVVIVTNEELGRTAQSVGVHTITMHDLLVDETCDPSAITTSGFVLCPMSYANDEPIAELIEAAAACPDITFYLTGIAPMSVVESASKNVVFTGYVDDQRYRELLRQCVAVVALTKRDLTMQRAGYEALMAGKPQVTSNFAVLEAFLEDAAAYADPTVPRDIAARVTQVFASPQTFSTAARKILSLRLSEQQVALKKLRSICAGAHVTSSECSSE